jgi:hypothetical protein
VIGHREIRHWAGEDFENKNSTITEEGKMKRHRVIRLAGALILLAAAFGIAQSPPRTSPSYEKICPISFELYPGTLLEKNYAAKIEKDNALLSVFLGDLREAANAATKGKTDLVLSNWYRTYLRTDGHVNPFERTYLADPKLTTEEGITVEGVSNVLNELYGIISKSTYIAAQSVHVYLEYLPYMSDDYRAKNPPGTPEDKIIDIIAHIKTVLAYAPLDPPVTIEGALPHRKVCDPGY